ncbi:MAG: CpaF family protein [Desulfobulbaceae bacterium]|nr:CpaF family protein [Desulfobulbaceae bacterium]
MALLKNITETPDSPSPAGQTVPDDRFFALKRKLHTRLIEEINLPAMDTMTTEEIRPEITTIVEKFLTEEDVLLNATERRDLINQIIDEMLGLGPIEPLLKDPYVSDILCNTYKNIYVERFGLLEKTNARFVDDAHLMNIIDRIISRVGRRIDESTPMVDARLPDGSRVNAIIPPLAIDGPILSIRRFSVHPLKMEDLINYKTLIPEIATLLAQCVAAKLNILISGGTGSGKTTLLNVLSGFIPANERIVTIEDSAELQLQQEHVVRLETRPASIEGTGRVTQQDLVRNSLRMRPDRIIIGEVRGAEAFDMLQAMNTGHEGSMGTIHANTPRDSLTRLESMILQTGINLPEKAMRFMISSALDLIIQITRNTDGSRKLFSLCEVVGMEGEVITLQEIFVFDKKGIDKDGKVIGDFRATGIRPKFAERLEIAGFAVDEELFLSDRI